MEKASSGWPNGEPGLFRLPGEGGKKGGP